MFPNSQYESWDSRFWQKGYTEAFKLQTKALTLRAQACYKKGFNNDDKMINPIKCELCNVVCLGPEEFIAHC